MRNPSRQIQSQIKRMLKLHYGNFNLVFEEYFYKKFVHGNLYIIIHGEKCVVSYVSSDNRINKELIRVCDKDYQTKEYLDFHTGETFIIPPLTEEEQAARDKIYHEFFDNIFRREKHE